MVENSFNEGKKAIRKSYSNAMFDSITSAMDSYVEANTKYTLTLILLTSTKWRAPASASKWRMGFNTYPANVDKMVGSCQC
jgi:hypothetical protein